MESLIAFKRAGADGVLTYFAPRAAEKLRSMRSACRISDVRRIGRILTAAAVAAFRLGEMRRCELTGATIPVGGRTAVRIVSLASRRAPLRRG